MAQQDILNTTKTDLRNYSNAKINNDFLNAQREVMQILLTAATHFGKTSAEVSQELLNKKNSSNLTIEQWLKNSEQSNGKGLTVSGTTVSWI